MMFRKGKLFVVFVCMVVLVGCNINLVNQGLVLFWFFMCVGDLFSFVIGVVGFENIGSNDLFICLILCFCDFVFKIYVVYVIILLYFELFSFVLMLCYYEFYEFEVRYLFYIVICEIGVYEECCEVNGEVLEKMVWKRKCSVIYMVVNVEFNCCFMLLIKIDYYYEIYIFKLFFVLFCVESFVINYIGDFCVQCSYKEKKGKIFVDSCCFNYGVVSCDWVDVWVVQMNEVDKDKCELLLLVCQQVVDMKKVGKFIYLVFC